MRVCILQLFLPIVATVFSFASLPAAENNLSVSSITVHPSIYDEWRWTRFSTESGLPSNEVYFVVETTDNLIWAVTGQGLCWYDGYLWHVVDVTGGRWPYVIPSVMYAFEDVVYFVMADRLYRGGRAGFDLIEEEVQTCAPRSKNHVIYRKGENIFEWKDGTVRKLPIPFHLYLFATRDMWTTRSGTVWINAKEGLYSYSDGIWTLRLQNPAGQLSVGSIAENAFGEGMISLSSSPALRGLWSWNGMSALRRDPSEKGDWIEAMDISDAGERIALYGTSEIILRHGSGPWKPLEPVPHQLKQTLLLRYRANGDLWVGARDGLYLYSASHPRWIYRKRPPPSKNRVNEICKMADGSLWLGTANGIEIHRQNGTLADITTINGEPISEVTGIAQDRLGRTWIVSGSSFDGAYCWDGKAWSHLEMGNKHVWGRFHKIRKDRSGDVWLLGLTERFGEWSASTGGAIEVDDGRVTRWSTDQGLPSNRVYGFAEGKDGALWFGTNGGISRYFQGTWKHWRPRADIPLLYAFALALDSTGSVWATDRSYGVVRIDPDGSIGAFTAADGLPSNEIWDIMVDSRNNVWVSAGRGIGVFDQKRWKCFGQSTGLVAAKVWPIYAEAESVFVGTTGSGLAILDLNECISSDVHISIEPPVVEKNSVLLRWRPVAYWGQPEPSNISTRFRVDEQVWSPWSGMRSATLPDVPTGGHTVTIQARNLFGENRGDSVWSRKFEIEPPLYNRPLIAIPLSLLLSAIVVLTVVQVVRKRKHRIALQASEAKYRRLTAATVEGIVLHRHGSILDANNAVHELVEKDSGSLIRQPLSSLFDGESRRQFEERLVGNRLTEELVLTHRRKDGSTVTLEVIQRSAPVDADSVDVLVIRDITEKKEAEGRILRYQAELQSLASAVSNAEEQERRRVASFLHDHIAQTLALCKLSIPSSEPPTKEQTAEILRQISHAIDLTRNLTFELSPPVLRMLSLSETIEWLCSQIQNQHNLLIYFDDDKLAKPMDESVRYFLYNAVREMFMNIIKHADARSAEVYLRRVDGNLKIEVTDDGRGFDPELLKELRHSRTSGFGLFNVRERLATMGGTLDITSAAGKGTTITCILPLRDLPEGTQIHEDTNSPR